MTNNDQDDDIMIMIKTIRIIINIYYLINCGTWDIVYDAVVCHQDKVVSRVYTVYHVNVEREQHK